LKRLKQNLRTKTFVGTCAKAPQIQVWTALIALLLLEYLQLRARFGWSLSNLAALLRQQLLVYRDLFQLIDQPFTATAARSRCRADSAFLVQQLGQQNCQTSTCNPPRKPQHASIFFTLAPQLQLIWIPVSTVVYCLRIPNLCRFFETRWWEKKKSMEIAH